MRSLKICMTAILAALCALFVALGTFTLTTAKADAPAPTTFTVLDNASIRLFNNENGAYGIRFKAYVGDTAKETPVDGAEYKMAIVPTQLIDLYNATDKTENVVEWLNDYAKSKGGTIATATCTPDSDGYITAAITDIYWFNLNRKFSAIAYYEINDQIGDVATLALDGSRSIVDVATAFKNSGEATTEETVVLDKFIAEGAEQDIGVLVGSQTASSFLTINSTYSTGTIETVTTEKGDGWKINVTEKKGYDHLELVYNKDLAAQRLAGYDTVKFSVYNQGTSNTQKLYLNAGTGMGSTGVTYPITAQSWNDYTVPASVISSCSYITIPFVKLNADYYVTNFQAYTAAEMGAEVVAIIDAMPSVEDMDAFDKAQITAARSAYDALSDKAKTYVTNLSNLTALETAYAEKFVMIEDMDGSSMFSFNTDYTTTQATLSYGDDAEYGEYMNIHYIAGSGNFIHGVVTMTFNGVDLSGCEKVYLYVYNGGTANRNLLTNIGGSLVTNYATLVAGEWTLVEFNAADFVTGKYMGIYSAQADTDYKFSAIYATTAAYEAKPVIEMIDNLPSENALTGIDYAKITAARSAYDALSSTTQTAVTNYANLQALETAYNEKFVTIFDMTSVSSFTVSTGWGTGTLDTTLSVGVDSEYGNYLDVKINEMTGTHEQLPINITKPTNISEMLADCDYVYFYVYNPGSDRNLLDNFGGKTNTSRVKLVGGQWTEVKIPVSEFLNGKTIGVYSAVYGTAREYKFSMIWATKTVAEQ
ncbi:MAG: hypothetical protein IJD54_02280 [Clostridia bacterium]|nr:hypothetical protein [Clostridia bacterium]